MSDKEGRRLTADQNDAPSKKIQAALATLTSASTGWKVPKNIKPKFQPPRSFAVELLKRADTAHGKIVMVRRVSRLSRLSTERAVLHGLHLSPDLVLQFPYPLTMFPVLDERSIETGLQLILDEATSARGGALAPEAGAAVHNARRVQRDKITRVQFLWFQFDRLPPLFFSSVYPNLLHLDIRQNALLTSLSSIASHLPNLASLCISDCPNLRTISHLAPTRTRHATADEESDELWLSRRLNLKQVWVRGCNLTAMSPVEWGRVFDALANSNGPLKLLFLSRNRLTYLHQNVGKLTSLEHLSVENNECLEPGGFGLPDELGNLSQLSFLSLCDNNLTRLPRTCGRLDDSCAVYLHQNRHLRSPPREHQESVQKMRRFFHAERMTLLTGLILFVPHVRRARLRANCRLYRPGGSGYVASKHRFERMQEIESKEQRQEVELKPCRSTLRVVMSTVLVFLTF